MHGVLRGRVRRLLDVWAVSRRGRAGDDAQASTQGGRRMTIMTRFASRLDLRSGAVDMTHGSGGRATAQLVSELFVRHFDNAMLRQGNDQAAFDVHAGRLV